MNEELPGQALARFAATLRINAIPVPVLDRAEDLMIDWLGSALAGKGARPVESIARFAERMGPDGGPSEVLIHRRGSSPLLAALANAAASHVAEQDDLHNASVLHPATVVFPPALAVAQALGRSGGELLAAAVAGYEVGIRVGEFLGRSHYRIFHTTGTAGTLAAAAAAGSLLRLRPEQMADAFGSAGTQAAGLWEFLREAADSKQLHTAHAAAAGLTAAYLAADGFTGARRIFDGAQGMAAGMSSDADVTRLTDRLGERWALAETSFKFHASCRHTHPAADALLELMRAHDLKANDVARVINGDPVVGDRFKVVFAPNYNASLAEEIIPAADLSEQISTAGMEASGTGNMKLALNGAITIGTLDGANIEIREHVGEDNVVIFGMTAAEVAEKQHAQFKGADAVDASPRLTAVVQSLASGELSPDDPSRFAPIVQSLLDYDRFMVAADFDAYWDAQRSIDRLWQSPADWWRASILNTARMCWFSSDRAVREYAREIWRVPVS